MIHIGLMHFKIVYKSHQLIAHIRFTGQRKSHLTTVSLRNAISNSGTLMIANNIPSTNIHFRQISNLTLGTKREETEVRRKIASHRLRKIVWRKKRWMTHPFSKRLFLKNRKIVKSLGKSSPKLERSDFGHSKKCSILKQFGFRRCPKSKQNRSVCQTLNQFQAGSLTV